MPLKGYRTKRADFELNDDSDATMALREILKSRTSAANQKSLTKEMEGRLGVQTSGGEAPVESTIGGEEAASEVKMDDA